MWDSAESMSALVAPEEMRSIPASFAILSTVAIGSVMCIVPLDFLRVCG